jgi:hypothetical protein
MANLVLDDANPDATVPLQVELLGSSDHTNVAIAAAPIVPNEYRWFCPATPSIPLIPALEANILKGEAGHSQLPSASS